MKINEVVILNEKDKKSKYVKFTNGVTYIYSHATNNRGKTILMNSIATLWGNRDFPQGFNLKEHVIMVEYEINNKIVLSTLREGRYQEIKVDDNCYIIETQFELSKIWNEKIYSLPKLVPNFSKASIREHIYPELLLELFMGFQEKSETTRLNSSNMYKKNQYIDFIYQMKYPQNNIESSEMLFKELDHLKKEIKFLKPYKKMVKNYEEIEKSALLFGSEMKIADKIIEELEAPIKQIQNKIYVETKKRNKLNELLKNTRDEKNIKSKLICKDCNSDNIVIIYKSLKFDVLNQTQLRKLDKLIDEDIKKINEGIELLIEQKNTMSRFGIRT